MTLKSKLKELIIKGHIKEVLELIITSSTEVGHSSIAETKEAIIILNQYRSIIKRRNQNLISEELFVVEEAKKIKATLELVENLDATSEASRNKELDIEEESKTKIIGVWRGKSLEANNTKNEEFYWSFFINGNSTFISTEKNTGKVLYSHTGKWASSEVQLHEFYIDKSTMVAKLEWINPNKFRINVIHYSNIPKISFEREYEKIL